MDQSLEKNLEEVGERLGERMKQASEEEKEILRAMLREIDEFAKEEEKKGKYLDRSALFAAGIIAHPDIKDEELMEIAKEYIEADYLFVKSLREAGVQ